MVLAICREDLAFEFDASKALEKSESGTSRLRILSVIPIKWIDIHLTGYQIRSSSKAEICETDTSFEFL